MKCGAGQHNEGMETRWNVVECEVRGASADRAAVRHLPDRDWENETPPGPNKWQQRRVPGRVLDSHAIHLLLVSIVVPPPQSLSAQPPLSLPLSPVPTMSAILVSKPTPISFSSAPYAHRRHPSAPVVVQPTRTPGVFSIKQKALTPARHLPSAQRQNNASPKVQAKPVRVTPMLRPLSLTPAPVIHDKKQAAVVPTVRPSTPTLNSRGRAHAKSAKDKAQAYRSASHSSVRGKHGRQPSPPIPIVPQPKVNQTPSQAEVSIISNNVFNPFLDSPSTSLISPPPSPTLPRPSANLARRGQNQSAESLVSPSPVHSKAIPVPSVKRLHYPNLSRSDPVPSHMQHARPNPKRSSTLNVFPICDDLNDAADDYPPSPPSTPSRPSHGGPRTAPISVRTPISFPFTKLEMPSPSRPFGGKRHHRRVPSEGVFNMSSDEDASSGPEGTTYRSTLLDFMSAKTTPSVFSTPVPSRTFPRSREQSPSFTSLTKEQQLEREAAEKAGYFASSMFQNSPSPEELPDPLLL